MLDISYLDQIYQLHSLVRDCLPDKAIYRDCEKNVFSDHLGSRGHTVGVLRDDRLVAFAVVRFPGTDTDNLGRDLGFACDALLSFAHLEFCAVHPDYRGGGLQRLLCRERIALAVKAGYRNLATTIAPNNVASIANHLRSGLQVKLVSTKYGGLIRLILHQEIGCRQAHYDYENDSVALADVEKIERKLSQGYVGLALSSTGAELILGRKRSLRQ